MKNLLMIAKTVLILTDKTNYLKQDILEVTEFSLDEIIFISF